MILVEKLQLHPIILGVEKEGKFVNLTLVFQNITVIHILQIFFTLL